MELTPKLSRFGLIASGAVLLAGDVVGMSHRQEYLILTGICVAAFNLQFWTLSDPTIVKLEKKTV